VGATNKGNQAMKNKIIELVNGAMFLKWYHHCDTDMEIAFLSALDACIRNN